MKNSEPVFKAIFVVATSPKPPHSCLSIIISINKTRKKEKIYQWPKQCQLHCLGLFSSRSFPEPLKTWVVSIDIIVRINKTQK